MKRMLWLAGALALCAGFWWYLFDYDALPRTSGFAIDWSRARELAGSGGPRTVHTERVARGEFYGWMLQAGAGWSREPMDFRSYQLVYADGHTIMIDGAPDRALHESMPLSRGYDDQAWNHQLLALRQARAIVLTHEHYDHAGGLHALVDDAQAVSRMYLSRAQRESGLLADSGFTDAQIAELPALDYTGMRRLAPGVVLIAAPGHTPGSQIIYVRRADGAEYAFIGDIVWNARNLLGFHAKSILIGLLAGENRAQLNAQIVWLARELRTTTVRFVIAHDPLWNAALIERGMLVEGFELR